MAQKKFELTPAPTFKATVAIPIPGGEPADIICTFRHRSRSELTTLIKDSPPDPDYLMAIMIAWDLDDEFNRANIERLIDLHQGAVTAIVKLYFSELSKGRLGN